MDESPGLFIPKTTGAFFVLRGVCGSRREVEGQGAQQVTGNSAATKAPVLG